MVIKPMTRLDNKKFKDRVEGFSLKIFIEV